MIVPVCPPEFLAGCHSGDMRHVHSAEFYSIINTVVLFIVFSVLTAVRVFQFSLFSPFFSHLFQLLSLAIPTGVFFSRESEKIRKKRGGEKRRNKKTPTVEIGMGFPVWEG